MDYTSYLIFFSDQMGFAGLCIQCPTSLALQRNSLRQIPIPRSTIETMEQRLELPDPAQYHWEARNIVLRNDGEKETFLRLAWYKNASLLTQHFVRLCPSKITSFPPTKGWYL